MTEWYDVGVPDVPKRRSRRDRVRQPEKAVENPDGHGGPVRRAGVEITFEAQEVEGDRLERGDAGGGEAPKSPTCEIHGKDLTCRDCDETIEKRAEEVLTEMGRKMSKEIKEDRVKAFENYADSLMLNQYVIAAARIMSLSEINKYVKDVHVMIGAPRKKSEEADDEPLTVMRLWLNGSLIPGFPVPETEEAEEANGE